MARFKNLLTATRRRLALAIGVFLFLSSAPVHADWDVTPHWSYSASYSFYAIPAAPAAVPLCFTGVGTFICVAAGASVICYLYCSDIYDVVAGMFSSDHTKNARKSTKDKHQKGDARRKRDQSRSNNRNKRR